MKKIENIIIGVIIIVIGVILSLNVLEITNINIFFKGWWTLFIIIPSLIGLIKEKDKTMPFIGLTVGIILFLSIREIIDFNLVRRLLIPIVLICIGLSIVYKSLFDNKKSINDYKSLKTEYCATFTSLNINSQDEILNHSHLTAVFGGVTYNVKNALLDKDVIINCSATFGGIDLLLPTNVNVVVKSHSLFGGVSNKHLIVSDSKYTIYVNATCLFGGVEIK